MHARDRRARQRKAAPESRRAKTMLDVARGLGVGQGAERAPYADALVQLSQIGPPELFIELRLPGQDDLQELVARRLERLETADLLERLDAHLLRFVDHDHDGLAFATDGEEVLAQHRH